ncbi:MAG: S1C family serine protease [Actinomycetota bacterium]
MADGDFDDDLPIGRRPPAPADRTWRHPAEIAAEMRAAKRRASRRIWGVGFGSALGGAMAVAAVWYLTDPGTDVQVVTQRVAVTPVESVAPRVTPADEWATEVASTARPATATIHGAEDEHALAGAIAVHDEGYLLTSGRALGDATELVIRTHEGAVLHAVVLGYDRETDLSVLKTDGVVAAADVAAVPAGDGDVVATVDPTGAANRAVVTDLAASATAVDGDLLVGLTSLDSRRDDLPPGSPVVDSTGAVVGITTAAEADAPVTIVPIEVANAVAEAIIAEGRVWHAWLGVSVAATDLDGVIVTATTPGGPADRAGLRLDDRVVAIDGRPIESAAALVGRLRHYAPGDMVEIVVERPASTVVLDATLDVDPADLAGD